MRFADKIRLSSRSTKLLSEYSALLQCPHSRIPSGDLFLDLEQLIGLLSGEFPNPVNYQLSLRIKLESVRTSLQASVLKDIEQAIDGSISRAPKEESYPSASNRIEYMLLAVSGAILAACEGFDSITSMADILPLTPILILVVGMFLASLSVIAFLGIDLVQVAQKLGINADYDLMLIDNYLLQWNEILLIRRKIASLPLAELSIEELSQLEALITGLQKQTYNIVDSGFRYKEELKRFDLKVAKTIITFIFGIMYFGMGYFTGQSVALYLLGFVIAAVSPTFWAVIAFSVLAGLSGFALFWNDRKVGLDKLVSSWMGLDEDKIEKISDKEAFEEQVNKLENLRHQLHSTALLIEKSVNRENPDNLKDSNRSAQAVNESFTSGERPTIAVGSNIFSFHHPNKSKDNVVGYDVDPDKSECYLF